MGTNDVIAILNNSGPAEQEFFRNRQPLSQLQFDDMNRNLAYDLWQREGAVIPGNEKGDWERAKLELLRDFYVKEESAT
jgi:Protein of unknown function (DUF2934)